MTQKPRPDYFIVAEAPDDVKDRFKCFAHIKYSKNGKIFSLPLCHENPCDPALQDLAKTLGNIIYDNGIICGTRQIKDYDAIIFPDMGESADAGPCVNARQGVSH